MTHRDVVMVGASAGGVEALRDLVAGLPADLPAAVLATRRGRSIEVRVTISPLRNRPMGGTGLLVVMDPRQD